MDFFKTFETEATERDSCLFVEPRQASFRLETQPVVVFAKSSASGATEVEVSWTFSKHFEALSVLAVPYLWRVWERFLQIQGLDGVRRCHACNDQVQNMVMAMKSMSG